MAEILQGGTGRHRNMAAFFLRAVQGGVVGKGLICLKYEPIY